MMSESITFFLETAGPIKYCCILGQQTLVEYAQCRTNEDVRMYIEEYLF